MKISVETNLDKFSCGEWADVQRQSPTATIFQTYAWHQAWWQSFEKDKSLFLVCAKTDHLLGVLPLMIVKKGRLRILKFIGTGQADYCDFLYPSDNSAVLRELLGFLFSQASQWDAIALDNIPSDSASVPILRDVCKKFRFPLRRYAQIGVPVLDFGSEEGFAKAVNKGSLKRHYKYFSQRPGYEVRHLTLAKDIGPLLNSFFQQHIDRRRLSGDRSLFDSDEMKNFYSNLVRGLENHQGLIFSVVQSEGKVIAFHFGFVYRKKFLWYKPSFDARLAKHSPGEVLLRELLVYAHSQGLDEFDFSIGEEPFKRRFSNVLRRNDSFKVFKSVIPSGLDLMISFFKR
ncbi:MAG: GNAT family N-acetyltransferase [Candidatus Omnitrophica bacterium]|nr:GNAT family N-acetyltransferase [Candidatus Omnitrophota bacterium]